MIKFSKFTHIYPGSDSAARKLCKCLMSDGRFYEVWGNIEIIFSF